MERDFEIDVQKFVDWLNDEAELKSSVKNIAKRWVGKKENQIKKQFAVSKRNKSRREVKNEKDKEMVLSKVKFALGQKNRQNIDSHTLELLFVGTQRGGRMKSRTVRMKSRTPVRMKSRTKDSPTIINYPTILFCKKSGYYKF